MPISRKGPVRVGIVGLGRAGGRMFCCELAPRNRKFRIVAVCDVMAERARRVAADCGARAYTRIKDLLRDEDVELVGVATRNIDHYAHASQALRAGKHVFLEKPMTATYAQARRLAALAGRSKGRLFVRHNARYFPGFEMVRRIVASGVLGEVFEIKLRRTTYLRRDDWQTLAKYGGGLLTNTGSHMVDHALCLLGAPVKRVFCELRRVAAVGDAEDHAKLIIVGDNGRIIDIEHSGGAAVTERTYTVLGTKGGLVSDGDRITLRYLDPRRKLKPRRASHGTPGRHYGSPEDLKWIEKSIAPPRREIGRIWDDLYAALRKGKPFPIAVAEAVEVMRIIHLAKKQTPFA